jgi:hypothetical protein
MNSPSLALKMGARFFKHVQALFERKAMQLTTKDCYMTIHVPMEAPIRFDWVNIATDPSHPDVKPIWIICAGPVCKYPALTTFLAMTSGPLFNVAAEAAALAEKMLSLTKATVGEKMAFIEKVGFMSGAKREDKLAFAAKVEFEAMLLLANKAVLVEKQALAEKASQLLVSFFAAVPDTCLSIADWGALAIIRGGKIGAVTNGDWVETGLC